MADYVRNFECFGNFKQDAPECVNCEFRQSCSYYRNQQLTDDENERRQRRQAVPLSDWLLASLAHEAPKVSACLRMLWTSEAVNLSDIAEQRGISRQALCAALKRELGMIEKGGIRRLSARRHRGYRKRTDKKQNLP